MANKPFLAVHTNITDEINITTTPSVIGRNPVMVTQAQQRRIFDTLTTSVQGNPIASFGANFQHSQPISYSPYSQHSNFLQAHAQFIPGGVVFRFISQNNYPPICHPCSYIPFQQGLTTDQEMALMEFERNGLESLLLQERLKKNPFVLQFHQNRKTSTSDLINGLSMGQPDFNTADAFTANNLIKEYPMYSSDLYSKGRQLNLPKNHKDKHITISEEKCTSCTMTTEKSNDTCHVTIEEEKPETSDSKELEDVKADTDNKSTCCQRAHDFITTDSGGSDDETEDEHQDKNKKEQSLY